MSVGSGVLTLGGMVGAGSGIRWVIGQGALTLGAVQAAGVGTRTPPPPPPPPKILIVRDALVADLNATVRPRSPTDFTARAAYALTDVELLQVSVLPTDLTEEQNAGQDTDTEHMQLHVVVRKRVENWSVTECDELLALAKFIGARYKLNTDMSTLSADLAGIGQVVLVEKQWFPLYNRFLMDTTGYFHSELVLIFREWVERPEP